jgi:CheY-like chemotaxis protein
MPEGLSVGSLCVLNRAPRTPTTEDHATLRRLADQTLQLIALRRQRAMEGAAERDTLLITDDEEGIRRFLADLFATRGIRTLSASNGAEALRLYRENASCIAVVLTDLNMPGINGLELVRALRRLPHPPRCVVMSGHLSELDRRDLAAAGAGLILNKPFSRVELDALGGLVTPAARR